MKRVARSLVSLAVLGALAVAAIPAYADASLPLIVAGFSAKETCSCAFVVEQTDEYCAAFGQIAGFTVATTIDHGAKTVKATYGSVYRTAHFDDGAGCVLDAVQ